MSDTIGTASLNGSQPHIDGVDGYLMDLQNAADATPLPFEQLIAQTAGELPTLLPQAPVKTQDAPDDLDDVYERLIAEGLTEHEAEEASEASRRDAEGIPYNSFRTSNPKSPYRVAEDICSLFLRHDAKLTLRRYREDWVTWDGTHWSIISKEDQRSWFYKLMNMATYRVITKEGPEDRPWNPDNGSIAKLSQSVEALTNLSDNTETNTWISSGVRERNVVSTKGGLLRLSDRKLIPHTPDYFTTYSLPYAYDEDAVCPEWDAFLADIMDHDPKAILTLQEIFGYVISGRTDLQKIFLIVGPPRGGKGTIGRVLGATIGEENVCGADLSQLEDQFGMWDLMESTLALFGDVTFDGRLKPAAKEKLLRISGEDKVRVDRKNRQPISVTIPARMVMLSNHIPNFGDSSGALPGRFVDIRLVKSFLGSEDLTLESRLMAELPGILNWALDGLDRLTRNGRFTQSEGGEEMKQLQKAISSPERVFMDEFCELGTGPEFWVLKEEFRHRWVTWRTESGVGGDNGAIETVESISRKLFSSAPSVRGSGPGTRKQVNGKQQQCFLGIRFKPEGAEQLPDDVA